MNLIQLISLCINKHHNEVKLNYGFYETSWKVSEPFVLAQVSKTHDASIMCFIRGGISIWSNNSFMVTEAFMPPYFFVISQCINIWRKFFRFLFFHRNRH